MYMQLAQTTDKYDLGTGKWYICVEGSEVNCTFISKSKVVISHYK